MTTKDFYRRRAALTEASDRAAGQLLVLGCMAAAVAAFYLLLSAF